MSDTRALKLDQRLLVVSLVAVPLCLVPFVPPHFGRAVALQAVGLAALISLCADTRWKAQLPRLLPIVVLLAPAVLSTLLSSEPRRSLLGSPARGGGLLCVLSMGVLAAFVALRAGSAVRLIRWWVSGLGVALVLPLLLDQAGYSLLPDWVPGRDLRGGLLHRGAALGSTLAVILPIIVAGCFDGSESRRAKTALGMSALFVALGLFLASNVGAQLAAGTGVGVVSFAGALRRGYARAAKVLFVAVLTVLIMGLSLLTGGKAPPFVPQDASPEGHQGRAWIYDEAVRAISRGTWKAQFFGHGLETTRAVLPSRHYAGNVGSHEATWGTDRTESVLFETLLTQGLLGLLGFSLAVVMAALRGARHRDPARDGVLAALASYVVVRLVSATHPSLEVLFAVVVGLLIAPPQARPPKAPADWARWFPVPIMLVIILLGAWTLPDAAATWVAVPMVGLAVGSLVGLRPRPKDLVVALGACVVVLLWSHDLRYQAGVGRALAALDAGRADAALELLEPLMTPTALERSGVDGALDAGLIGRRMVVDDAFEVRLQAAFDHARAEFAADPLPSLLQGQALRLAAERLERTGGSAEAVAAKLSEALDALDRAKVRFVADPLLLLERAEVLRAQKAPLAALDDLLSAGERGPREGVVRDALVSLWTELSRGAPTDLGPSREMRLARLLVRGSPHRVRAGKRRDSLRAVLSDLSRKLAVSGQGAEESEDLVKSLEAEATRLAP